MSKAKDYPAYQFKSLPKFTSDEVSLLNLIAAALPDSKAMEQIVASVSETLVSYDICNWENIEIGLLVKPVGEVATPQFYKLPQAEVSLGRTNDNHISLKSPLVSKKHAEITLRGTEYYLRDLQSNNGTFLNDVKINPGTEVVLKNDDVIKIEPYEIVVGVAHDILKLPLDIKFHSAGMVRNPDLKNKIGIFYRIQPSPQSALLLLDRQVALWMIRKIISGHQQTDDRTWTEVEEGLLEYLAAKMLTKINPLLKDTSIGYSSLEKDEDELSAWMSKQEKLVEAVFTTHTEKGVVFAQLLMPAAALKKAEQNSASENFLAAAPWLAAKQYSFAVDVGVSVLSSDQIPVLEEGDIILLDRTGISLEANVPKGKVELRSHYWRGGAITGVLSCDSKGNSSITMEALYQEGLKGMTEAKKTEAQQETPTGEALGGIDVPVTVEFARLNFTLDEISSFKEGQIIEFEKGAPEAVDLSVDG
ncbi:MAG TPA: FHA domain-containing protein, partial [Acidobacteriota bacterium]|nr:FHA domain-containing protein [Acidobacteriota bacterium]